MPFHCPFHLFITLFFCQNFDGSIQLALYHWMKSVIVNPSDVSNFVQHINNIFVCEGHANVKFHRILPLGFLACYHQKKQESQGLWKVIHAYQTWQHLTLIHLWFFETENTLHLIHGWFDNTYFYCCVTSDSINL